MPGSVLSRLIPRRDAREGVLDAERIAIVSHQSQDDYKIEEVFLGAGEPGDLLHIPGFKLFTMQQYGPDSAFMVGTNVMIEDVRIKAAYSNSTGVIITCTSCDVMILRTSFENLTQKLDFGTWFKCRFIDCSISYMGERITLVQCEFDNCTFRFAASVSLELREMIESGTATVPMLSNLQ